MLERCFLWQVRKRLFDRHYDTRWFPRQLKHKRFCLTFPCRNGSYFLAFIGQVFVSTELAFLFLAAPVYCRFFIFPVWVSSPVPARKETVELGTFGASVRYSVCRMFISFFKSHSEWIHCPVTAPISPAIIWGGSLSMTIGVNKLLKLSWLCQRNSGPTNHPMASKYMHIYML